MSLEIKATLLTATNKTK